MRLNMKKHGYIILCLVMSMFFTAAAPLGAAAEGEPFEIVQDKTALSSYTDIMKIDFNLPENSGLRGVEIEVTFPKDKLKLVDAVKGDAFGNAFAGDLVSFDDHAKVMVLYADTTNAAQSVCSLSFSKAQGASGTAEIKIDSTGYISASEGTDHSTALTVDLGSEAAATAAPTQKPSQGNTGSSRPDSTASPSEQPSQTSAPAPTSVPTAAPRVSFTDIDGHWAKDSIERLAARGLINGFEDNTFRPDMNVTRAQFVTMLVNAKGIDTDATVKIFDDVDTGAWYAPYVTAAYSAAIASGDGVNFHPDSEITRQEAAAMAARAFGLEGEGSLTFADNADIASWAAQSVGALVSGGIISGFEDNTFRPLGNTTRAQAAIILDKLPTEN